MNDGAECRQTIQNTGDMYREDVTMFYTFYRKNMDHKIIKEHSKNVGYYIQPGKD